jgi:hypothetical protein
MCRSAVGLDIWGYEVQPLRTDSTVQGTGRVVIGRIARFYLQLLSACMQSYIRGGVAWWPMISRRDEWNLCASVPQEPVALIVKRIPRVSSAGEL